MKGKKEELVLIFSTLKKKTLKKKNLNSLCASALLLRLSDIEYPFFF